MPLLLLLSTLIPPPGLGTWTTPLDDADKTRPNGFPKHVSRSKRHRDALRACMHWSRSLLFGDAHVSCCCDGPGDPLDDGAHIDTPPLDAELGSRKLIMFDELFQVLLTSVLPFAVFYRASAGCCGRHDSTRQRNLLPLPLLTTFDCSALVIRLPTWLLSG